MMRYYKGFVGNMRYYNVGIMRYYKGFVGLI